MVLVYPVAFWQQQNQASIDPFADNVVLFLKGDDTNGSTNIIDSSPNPKTITRFGNAQISTAQSKYGGSSILFNGDTDFLTIPANTDFAFGTNDYTIEYWINFTQFQADINNLDTVFDMRPDSTNGNFIVQFLTVANLKITTWSPTTEGSQIISASSTSLVLNQWFHVAYSRSSGTVRLFINGALEDSRSNSTNIESAGSIKIGTNAFRSIASGLGLFAYVDSFRITKLVGRYIASFNPETDTYLN